MRLIEHYLSIQGEGLHSGKPTYFVRFARCNLRCAWCDSEYTFGDGDETTFDMVAEAVTRSKAQIVCLTGGEPLLHTDDCLHLIRHFPLIHFDIETGGSLDIAKVLLGNVSVVMDWKLSGSGMNGKMRKENLPLLRLTHDLLKFVTDGSDTERSEIEDLIRRTQDSGVPVSIQPVFGTEARPLAEWTLSIKNPRIQFNLQMHKYIWTAQQAGV